MRLYPPSDSVKAERVYWEGMMRETLTSAPSAHAGLTTGHAPFVEEARSRGELYIEIGVAPVRPAEFIVVRIGLWDGGAQISEG